MRRRHERQDEKFQQKQSMLPQLLPSGVRSQRDLRWDGVSCVCCNPDWRGDDRRDHYSGSDDGDGNGDSGGGGGAVAADMAEACNSTEIEIGKSQYYYDSCCQLPDQLALANGPAVRIMTRRMWEFNVDCGLVVFLHWESNNFKMEHASQPSQYKKQKVISNNTNAQACLLLRWS